METGNTISAKEMLRAMRSRGGRLLDVRSEGEFADGVVPGSFNVPILNDEHRHIVGLEYKNAGNGAAVELGHKLVDPLRPSLVARWTEGLLVAPPELRFVMCWRGGQRSHIASSWIAEAGVESRRVEGGFKAVRRVLMETFERTPELTVFGGFTGSGKTRLLAALDAEFVLDLEKLAFHRGSIFGRHLTGQQPTQVTFENELGLAFFERHSPYVCEAESRLIGTCCIPNSLKEKMDASDFVLIHEPVETRARNVFDEYVLDAAGENPPIEHWFMLREHFRSCLRSIQRRLGGALFAELDHEMMHAFEKIDFDFDRHARWIRPLLASYYDRLYEHSLSRGGRRPIFEGNWEECHEFLTARLKTWQIGISPSATTL